MLSTDLEFVASLTVAPSDIRKIRQHLEMSKSTSNPLKNVLITPLFANPASIELVRAMKSEGTRVYFDSGGYYVQTGRMAYDALYYPLLQFYLENQWADLYVLPDHVPTSQDAPDTVERKVVETIQISSLFYEELPAELKVRAMPVVHGHTTRQIVECLSAYRALGVRHLGFGSFGTVGRNSEVNVALQSAVELAREVARVARESGISVHFFGLGVPALAAMLKGIGATSFDSSSWLKAAGFGQVFLPFMRAYNVSSNNRGSQLQKGIKATQFYEYRKITGHSCGLCERTSYESLQTNKMFRAAHNLVVLAETVDMVNRAEFDQIHSIYQQGSAKYRNEAQKWLTN